MNKIDPRVKTALVTGSAKRNGRALANWLSAQGVKVAVHYMNSRQSADEALTEVNANTPGGVLVQGDLTDADQAARVVNEAADGLGGLDLLVNNVGNYQRKDLFELTPAEWRDQIESNLYSAWFCMQPAVLKMRKQGFGRGRCA